MAKSFSVFFSLLMLCCCLIFAGCDEPIPCTFSAENTPVFRGIKLGMTQAEVYKLYPNAIIEFAEDTPRLNNGVESSYISLSKPQYNKQLHKGTAFDGISQFKFKVMNKQIYEIEVEYFDNDYEFKSLDEFAAQISTKFNLPDKWWLSNRAIKQNNQDYRWLECNGYAFAVGYRKQYIKASYFVRLTDTKIEGKALDFNEETRRVQDKQKEAQDQMKQNTFEP